MAKRPTKKSSEKGSIVEIAPPISPHFSDFDISLENLLEKETFNERTLHLEHALANEIDNLQNFVRKSLESHYIKIGSMLQKSTAAQENSARTVEEAAQTIAKKGSEGFTMYDDLDFKLTELRELVESRQHQNRGYDHFFYGLVITLLLAIIGMLTWSQMLG